MRQVCWELVIDLQATFLLKMKASSFITARFKASMELQRLSILYRTVLIQPALCIS